MIEKIEERGGGPKSTKTERCSIVITALTFNIDAIL